MSHDFHALAIDGIRPEIGGEANSVTFNVPPELAETFQWQAGQHLTLRFHLDGAEHRRCYTISNPPGEALRISVKKVPGGLVSNHIATGLAAGDRIDVLPPFGSFALVPGQLARRTHYFFGAGSGITPLYAMINAVLEDEPHSVAHLVYGNKTADGIIFRKELDTLEAGYPERFSVRHVLSSPSLWSMFTPWRSGRVDAEIVKAVLTETPPVAQDTQYWICGPGAMNADVKAALMALDVPADRIHMESFGGTKAPDKSAEGVDATARISLNGDTRDIPVLAGQTVLEAVRAADLAPPFSCQSGVCGACKARLTDGRVHMHSRMALDDGEIDKGEILTCQSVAMSEQLAVRFED